VKKPTLKEQGFYHTPAWRKLRVVALRRDKYLCQDCLKDKRVTLATEVHHMRPAEDYPELALDIGNLRCLCWHCHELTKYQGESAAKSPAGVRIIKA